MLSATLNNLPRKAIFLPSTEMKETLEKHKKTLEIFRNLKQNEKLGKQKDVSGVMQYYKVGEYRGMFISRWYYGEGRYKTIEYLDVDFSEFMKYLDELLKNLEVDPYCYYMKLGKQTKEFIDEILPGLYSLKKTYHTCKEMVAKVDSIILTLIDFKDSSDELIRQKERNSGINLMIHPLTREI